MISVIIPTHNRIGDLKKALQSVYCQTALPSEIIVVDDGSSPSVTKKIFDEAPKSIKTLLLCSKTPQGANNARNMGINAASSNWIAFLDDDDEFISEKIEFVEQIINEKGAEIDLIYHPALIVLKHKNIYYRSKCKMCDSEKSFFEHMLTGNHVGGTSMVVVKKTSLQRIGGFDVNVHFQEDYELWLRMSKENMRFEFFDCALTKYYYVIRGGNITNKRCNAAHLAIIEEKYSNDIKKLSPKLKKLREISIFNTKILNAYLNGKYCDALTLNAIAFLKFKNVKYLMALFLSLMGSDFVFWARSKLSQK